MDDKLARQVYAEKIATEIVDHYDGQKTVSTKARGKGEKREEENIIFAISGKWGEGKTVLLNFLEKPLEDKGFRIIKFNPWKYSQEDITLKRAFLRTLKEQLGSSVDLNDLYFDRTKTSVNLNRNKILTGVVIGSLIYLIAIPCLLGALFNISLFNWLNWSMGLLSGAAADPFVKGAITLLLIPVVLKILTISRRSANVSTAEEFEEKFYELLDGYHKIVIFIDDLDRCDSKTVKIILDSLKTFFQHPECSYIITGDHTVIERYAADMVELPEDTSDAKRLQEGRRFLKKLFDVYWRLPLPTPHQFGVFVDQEIKESKIEHLSDSQLANIKSFLIDDGFFERNPRHVKRFLTKLRFALEGVRLQKEQLDKIPESDQDAKESLADILANPDLLAKVLLTEEFFYPIYEKLILYPDELITHEKKLRLKTEPMELLINGGYVGILMDKDEGEARAHASRYASLVDRSPKFTDENNTTLHEVGSYLSFSGSTGLPSALGPDEANFEQYLRSGQLAEKLERNLKVSKPDRRKAFANKALEIFDATADPTERLNIARESLKLVLTIDEWTEKLPEWKEKLFALPAEDQQNALAPDFWSAVLKKKPDIISIIKGEKPAYLESLWPILENLDTKEFDPRTIPELEKVLEPMISEQPLNLKGLGIYLQKVDTSTLGEKLNQQIVDLPTAKTYFDHAQSVGASGARMVSIATKKMKDLTSHFINLDWIVANKDFLKTAGLLSGVSQSAVLWAKDTQQIGKVLDNKDAIEISNDDTLKIKKYTPSLVEKSSDLEFLKSASVRALLDKNDRVEIFRKLNLVLEDNTESLDKRKNVAEILKKSEGVWDGIDKNDVYPILKELKKLKLGKFPDLKEKPKEILDSWGYEDSSELKEEIKSE